MGYIWDSWEFGENTLSITQYWVDFVCFLMPITTTDRHRYDKIGYGSAL